MGNSSDAPHPADGRGSRWSGPTPTDERAAFLAGLAHFNAGDFYQAHDAWEAVWADLDGRRALFYQTLIQTAVLFVLMQNGQAAGVRAVYASLIDKLNALPAMLRGVDLARLRRDLDHAAGWIVERPPGQWRDVARRTVDGEAMLFDPQRAFRIDLRYDPFLDPRDGDP